MVSLKGIRSKGRGQIKYGSIQSVILPYGKRSEIPAISETTETSNNNQIGCFKGSSERTYSNDVA